MIEDEWEIDYKTKHLIYKGDTKRSSIYPTDLYNWLQAEMEKEDKKERIRKMIETFKKL